jgi:hypothetical protein
VVDTVALPVPLSVVDGLMVWLWLEVPVELGVPVDEPVTLGVPVIVTVEEYEMLTVALGLLVCDRVAVLVSEPAVNNSLAET